jgi:hypothetical protein
MNDSEWKVRYDLDDNGIIKAMAVSGPLVDDKTILTYAKSLTHGRYHDTRVYDDLCNHKRSFFEKHRKAVVIGDYTKDLFNWAAKESKTPLPCDEDIVDYGVYKTVPMVGPDASTPMDMAIRELGAIIALLLIVLPGFLPLWGTILWVLIDLIVMDAIISIFDDGRIVPYDDGIMIVRSRAGSLLTRIRMMLAVRKLSKGDCHFSMFQALTGLSNVMKLNQDTGSSRTRKDMIEAITLWLTKDQHDELVGASADDHDVSRVPPMVRELVAQVHATFPEGSELCSQVDRLSSMLSAGNLTAERTDELMELAARLQATVTDMEHSSTLMDDLKESIRLLDEAKTMMHASDPTRT